MEVYGSLHDFHQMVVCLCLETIYKWVIANMLLSLSISRIVSIMLILQAFLCTSMPRLCPSELLVVRSVEVHISP